MTAAKLLGLDVKELIKAMTKKKTIAGKEIVFSELTLEQTYMARNALVKDLYCCIFSWIIKKINSTISEGNQSSSEVGGDKSNFIGILDIFGFEDFDKNGFE